MLALPKPFYDDGRGIQIYHARAEDVLLLLQPGIVVTDPPYGTGGWRRLASGAGSNPSGSLIREDWDGGDVDWLALLPGCPVLTFWPAARTSLLLNAANAAGLAKHRCLYMRKPDPKPLPGGRTKWSVEPIWVLSRDGFVLQGGDDVYESSTPRRGQADATGHPYQKPLRVMLWLLSKVSMEPVVDPFMGSGTTLLAAKNLGRRAVGIEISEAYCEIAARRLAQEVLAL